MGGGRKANDNSGTEAADVALAVAHGGVREGLDESITTCDTHKGHGELDTIPQHVRQRRVRGELIVRSEVVADPVRFKCLMITPFGLPVFGGAGRQAWGNGLRGL